MDTKIFLFMILDIIKLIKLPINKNQIENRPSYKQYIRIRYKIIFYKLIIFYFKQKNYVINNIYCYHIVF